MNKNAATRVKELVKGIALQSTSVLLSAFLRKLPPFSCLSLLADSDNWVLHWEMREIGRICRRKFGIKTIPYQLGRHLSRQCFFFSSQFFLLTPDWFSLNGRIATSFFHGLPGTGFPEFDLIHENLQKYHSRIHRIQVSHSQMEDILCEEGIPKEKIFRIPIGINLSFFTPQSSQMRKMTRESLGIPQSAVVIGSFQKDGNGWEEGLEPKLIKGPDVFLKSLRILREHIPDLFVLLSGPSRGFVKRGLEDLGIPFCHQFPESYPDVGKLYQALDLYIVSSRQEGGPKAILESMASGVPLVTTKVGQAMDLVKHGENGWMAEIEDAEGLAHWASCALHRTTVTAKIVQRGLITAKQNSYSSQIPLWRNFFKGFVSFGQQDDQ